MQTSNNIIDSNWKALIKPNKPYKYITKINISENEEKN